MQIRGQINRAGIKQEMLGGHCLNILDHTDHIVYPAVVFPRCSMDEDAIT